MANKQYQVILDGKKIGTTELEKADASMGVVFGKLRFEGIDSGYQFLNAYCRENNIETEDHPEDKLISTRDITDLKVVNADGKEIKGVASSISGMDADGFEITIEGIPYPFYETEFPHHVLAYNQRY